MRRALTGLLTLSAAALAGGYRIPEQSILSTGTAGAYFSSASDPSASYYNPANMAFMDGSAGVEVGLRYIRLPSVEFRGRAYDPVAGSFTAVSESSEAENFFIPYFHYISPKVGDLRFGLSLVTPAGLSKRWEGTVPKAHAGKFLLEVYELDLTASYLITDTLAVGGGLRGVYARGEVEYERAPAYSLSMDGDTGLLPGAFVSVSYRPFENLTVSTLYRTEVNLRLEGGVNGYLLVGSTPVSVNGTTGSVEIPLPAEWRIGASYRAGGATFEITYERTFWSAYERLDFNYDRSPLKGSSFDTPKDKNWKDTSTYRFAVLYDLREDLLLMGGVAYDESPVPARTMGFDLPDSNGWILSAGGLFSPSPQVEVGLAYLIFIKGDRSVSAPPNTAVSGEFSDISAHLLNLSLAYRF